MNIFYSDSKTDLKLGQWLRYKIPPIWGCPRHCYYIDGCMLHVTTPQPYRLHQHYNRHVCGSYCSCKHWFLWIYPIFEHWFCLNYMGTVHHLQTFWPSTRVCLIGQCWYINPQWTSEWLLIKAHSVSHLEKMCSYKVSSYLSVFVEGYRRWRGTFWLLNGVLQHS
jgi:hypothetical protein